MVRNVVNKEMTIEMAVYLMEKQMRRDDTGSGLFHRGRNDGCVDVGEMLESMEKRGFSRKERLEFKSRMHGMDECISIKEATKLFREKLIEADKMSDRDGITSPQELQDYRNRSLRKG